MNQDLIKKAHKLRSRGFTVGEIADELNVSMDTSRWLTVQKIDEEDETIEVPVDFAINWNSLGGSSSRLRHVSAALCDMALSYGDVDAIVGIAVSGIPFATMMADFLDLEEGVSTALSVFHPVKHGKSEKNREGAISENFASVSGKKVIIVDDVITSGKTVTSAIQAIRNLDGKPIAVTVLIDKVGISKIEGIPVESLMQVKRLD